MTLVTPLDAGRSIDPAVADVTVIICAHSNDRWDLLVRSVDSMARQTLAPARVVLVIDHNESLAARARAELGPAVDVIVNQRERGACGARNAGLESCTTTFVAFLDDDAVASPAWVAEMLGAFTPMTAGVGGRAEAAWAPIRPGWFPPEFDWVVGCSYRGQAVGAVRNVFACNMAFRTDLLVGAGGFDQAVGRTSDGETIDRGSYGLDDTDACLRVLASYPGLQITQLDGAVVAHHVHGQRATFRYFVRRCAGEGVSKARLRGRAGGAALATERGYVTSVLPRGVVRALAGGPRTWPVGAAIVVGLAATVQAYLRELAAMTLRGASRGARS